MVVGVDHSRLGIVASRRPTSVVGPLAGLTPFPVLGLTPFPALGITQFSFLGLTFFLFFVGVSLTPELSRRPLPKWHNI